AAGATVTVTEVKPSTNANLGSLKLSEGTLTPAFKAGTVNYTASVKYQTEKITISANAAVGDSRVTGAGTFDLKVGDNTRSVTVTAASGDKKTYPIKIRRMTEDETAAAEKEERENNPLLFEYNGADRFIVPDLTNMEAFEGFALSSLEIKGAKVGYLADKHGKYSLFWATDADSANGAFYNRDENGEYTKVNCLQTENRIFIIEPMAEGINVSSKFTPAKKDVNGENVDCYKYSGEALEDFFVFYCYFNGKSDYYMLDAAQNTVQREPTFLATETTEADAEISGNILDKFSQLNTQAKILLLLLCFAGLLVLVLIVLLIVKAVNGKKGDFETDDLSDTAEAPADYVEILEEKVRDEELLEEPESQADEPEYEETAKEEQELTTDNSPETENEYEKAGNGAPENPVSKDDTSEFIDFGDDF
ncbi:MAG: cadherin-like beta sandwich domain-containing protein, partial [Clostridia bacterium]|nr:cadherin-like beta sandwich domain-containing protein [Clostridia bacterium]